MRCSTPGAARATRARGWHAGSRGVVAATLQTTVPAATQAGTEAVDGSAADAALYAMLLQGHGHWVA